MAEEPEVAEVAIAAEIATEHPGLRLHAVTLPVSPGRSPRGVRQRLAQHSNKLRGAQAIALRREPVPHAYRVFFRHIGLDPDDDRVPAEEAVVRRLVTGAFRSHGVVADACTLALLETGVPVWALDADSLEGDLLLRTAGDGERLGPGEHANWLPRGRLVLADDAGIVGVLFGDLAPEREPGRRTRRVTLLAVQVPNVPEIHVEEALWHAVDVIESR